MPNGIIACPNNRLLIEVRYDIEVPCVVAHVACSSFTRLGDEKPGQVTAAQVASGEGDISDMNLLDMMESFSKGVDLSLINDEGGMAEFYQEAAEQLSGFCDAIKARVIPYASQIYFNAPERKGKDGGEGGEEEEDEEYSQ
eukprot:gnl/Chilomastix_caulleri/725.p1 GENE.gnl/Chilomastix_caulleri/725~~gnl/Chilomastix_caulleri/725.p1  ORF type:complete len:141 (+),score=51.90 gnl/Chilomastix_caulleri/725:272-694(+)